MPLAEFRNVSIGFRGPNLLDEVSFVIEANQRIGLLGRNGAGKSTLLRLLSGLEKPDHGEIVLSPGTQVALLQQDVPDGQGKSVRELVLESCQRDVAQPEDHWIGEQATDQVLDRMDLDGDLVFRHLSSGMKRRVLLAQALVMKPQLLLLDEPTNHLDIDAIDWMESFLAKWSGAILFVTHDRMFLRRMADRILEIDRGQIFDWTCDYDTFLKRKDQQLEAEEKQNALFDRKLAEEEAWIRKGIKARRTRNEGRVRALQQLRRESAERRNRVGTSNLRIQEAERSGNLVIEAKDVSFGYDATNTIEGFFAEVFKGDRIGLIGPNGAGKSTLLKLLLKHLEPGSGKVRHGSNLKIAYFDQLREQLDPEKTVAENVGDGYDFIQIGENKNHVLGYLQEFLFTPERSRTEVRFLSGGERNRILLAKLFAKPANLIVLDEPTNDLDAETLEMLEERLIQYSGTLITVSHDREFLNNVVTSTIVFEPTGIKEYVGGYDDWIRQRPQLDKDTKSESKSSAVKVKKTEQKTNSHADASVPRKLKYKEQKELEQLPERIEKLESTIASLHDSMADPAFFKQDGTIIAESQKALENLNHELSQAYQRWEELESLAG